ncbi:reductive dehalogenase [Acidobacteriota bacterium]
MDIVGLIGRGVFFFAFLFFFLMSVYSLYEKEYRAWTRSTLLMVAAGGIYFILEVLLPNLSQFIFCGLLAATLLFVSIIIISPKPRKELAIDEKRSQIDERDIIFARFDLTPGSSLYSSYYSERPERKLLDDQIRDLPDLFAQSHIDRDPVLQSLAEAEFSFLEHQMSIVDGKVKDQNWLESKEYSTTMVKSVLKYLGAEQAGICHLELEDIYSHVGRGPETYGSPISNKHPFAVAFTVEMDYSMMQYAPKAKVLVETAKQYVDAARISIILADFLRRIGFSARAHIAGSNYQAMLVPVARKAGLGELGRIGMLMTPQYGPRVRLGLVTTDFPLISDRPVVFGALDFCERCKKCAVNCPAQAIPHGDRICDNGVEKWVIDREACYRYWRKVGTDCARCVYVCPYSKPDNIFHNFIRAVSKQSSFAQGILKWGDDLFYGKKPHIRKNHTNKL